mgnify:CR=1 FL=1
MVLIELSITLATLASAYLVAHLLSHTNLFDYLDHRTRISSIDGLRGFLSISVFICHFSITYYWITDATWKIPNNVIFYNYGKVSVAMFFMISGYLFTKNHMDKKKFSSLKFFESRIFRIYPLYILVVCIVFFIVLHQTNYSLSCSKIEFMKSFLKWILFLGCPINNYNDTKTVIAYVDWTLKYEWIFYLSFPFIIYFITQYKFYFKITMLLLGLYFFINPINLYYFNSKYFFLFIIGCLIADNRITSLKNRLNFNSTYASSLNLVLILSILFYTETLSPVHLLVISVSFFLFAQGNDLFGLLNSKPSKILGEISYSMYLLHGLLLSLSFTHLMLINIKIYSFHEFLIIMPFFIIPITLLCVLTFICVENPMNKIGKRYILSKKLSLYSKSFNPPEI